MDDEVTVTSWVKIERGCPLDYGLVGTSEMEFIWGIPPGAFEFVMETEALREFLRVGAQALDEMDALLARRRG